MEEKPNAHQMLVDGRQVSPGQVAEANRALVQGITQSAAQPVLGKFHDFTMVPADVKTRHLVVRLKAENLAVAMEGLYREVGRYHRDGTLRPEATGEGGFGLVEDKAVERDPIPTDSPRCNCEDSVTAACPIHPPKPSIPPAQATSDDIGPCTPSD